MAWKMATLVSVLALLRKVLNTAQIPESNLNTLPSANLPILTSQAFPQLTYTPVGPQVLYVADPACLAALVGQPLMAAAHTLLREQTAMGEALQVNAKQHRAILRRREKRQREYEKGQLLHSRKPYRNRLVHDFASSRPRNEKGHFVATAIAAAAAAGSQPPTGPAVPAPALASLAVAEGEGVAAEGGLGADSRPEEDTVVEDGVLGAAAAAAAGVALVTGDDALAAEALACLPQVQQQQQQGGIGNLPADLHGQQGAGEGQQQQ